MVDVKAHLRKVAVVPDEVDLTYFEVMPNKWEAEADVRVKTGSDVKNYTGFLKVK